MSNTKKRSAGSYFSNNLFLKLISILFAIILWSFVTTQTNPERTKVLYDIPVTLQGVETLESKGFTVRDNFTENTPTITVRISAKYSEYRYIDSSVVFASLDVSNLSTDGTAGVNVSVVFSNVADATLISVEPRTINVVVDKIAEAEIPFEVSTFGTLVENLVSFSPQYPEKITIKGSSYYVERISKAIADVDLSKLSDGDVIKQGCRFVDENNNLINFTGPSVSIDMDIQTKKTVPVNTVNAAQNQHKLADGYQLDSITVDNVELCGHVADIAGITEVKTGKINLADKDSTFTSSPISLSLPQGISLVPGAPAPTAKISISQKKSSVTVERYISVSGIPNGMSATISADAGSFSVPTSGVSTIKASILVTGTNDALKNISTNDILVRIFITETAPGTYTLTPTVALSPALASNATAQIVSPSQVTITLK